jgi:hypothetical protein
MMRMRIEYVTRGKVTEEVGRERLESKAQLE